MGGTWGLSQNCLFGGSVLAAASTSLHQGTSLWWSDSMMRGGRLRGARRPKTDAVSSPAVPEMVGCLRYRLNLVAVDSTAAPNALLRPSWRREQRCPQPEAYRRPQALAIPQAPAMPQALAISTGSRF